MADIFKATRGTVMKSSDGAMGILTLSLAPSDFLIFTGVAIQRNQVTQYVKTLDSSIYGYAWGEGPGRIIISGIIFLNPNCAATSGDGVGVVNEFYTSSNVYAQSGPISVSLGSTTFLGYLEGMNISAEMNEFNFANFTLEMSIINGGKS